MEKNKKAKIIIIEDAKGIAKEYKKLLEEAGYNDITICHTGESVQSLIDNNKKFDLAIMDIMLSPENLEKYTLAEGQDTGVRLIRKMIEKNICCRFYVITVRKSLKDDIERLCREKKVVLMFESKIDQEPERFVDNVRDILERGTSDGDRGILLEIEECVEKIEAYASSINFLSEKDNAEVMLSVQWLEKVLKHGRDLRNVTIRTRWLNIIDRANKALIKLETLSGIPPRILKQTKKTISEIQELKKQIREGK